MAKSLKALKAELASVEDKLTREDDPTEVAVLAGRIIELKNEVAEASGADPAQDQFTGKSYSAPAQAQSAAPAPAPAPRPKPASESKPTISPAAHDVQIAKADKDAQDAKDALAASQAAAAAATTGIPAAKADAAAAKAPSSQTDRLARAASRMGVDPSRIPIALRPTRN